MFDRIRSIFTRSRHRDVAAPPPASPAQAGGMRHFDAAKTSRINRAHWARAKGEPINQILRADREILCIRSNYEADNNSFARGVIETYATDVVGEHGPTLQVQTANKQYGAILEKLWSEWWANCDSGGEMAGVDLLLMAVGLDWKEGEALFQVVSDMKATSVVKARLLPIAPHRLSSPLGLGGPDLQKITLGVERDELGKVLNYWIRDEVDTDLPNRAAVKWRQIPARDMLHLFERESPGQARGIPWLAPALGSMAELRDYDDQVMDAARAAADSCILLQTTDPNIEPMMVNEVESIERRSIGTIPPGWTANQMKPEQPATTYKEFRQEKLRDIGRRACMPLMLILLDASGHNYSSARFDSQHYIKNIAKNRKRKERQFLNKCLGIVQREAEFSGALPPRPTDLQITWAWPPHPHVDPEKEATASETRLKNGLTTHTQEWAASGIDPEQVIDQLLKERDLFKAAGLPSPREMMLESEKAARPKSNGAGTKNDESAAGQGDKNKRADDWNEPWEAAHLNGTNGRMHAAAQNGSHHG